MRVAVVSPYFRESLDWLRECHDSVRAQTHACTHIMVADGYPRAEVAAWPGLRHIALPVTHGNGGDTPRAIGSIEAIGAGFDAIAYLDSDNSYAPDHIESLVDLHRRTGAAFCSSTRYLCRVDGSIMAECLSCDGETFVDTNCMFFGRQAFRMVTAWVLMPDFAHVLCDRVVFRAIKNAELQTAHTGRPTVYYRSKLSDVYRNLGEPIPPGVSERNPWQQDAAHDLWVAGGRPTLRVEFKARCRRGGYADVERARGRAQRSDSGGDALLEGLEERRSRLDDHPGETSPRPTQPSAGPPA
jgi:hypothetical protein